MVRLARVPSGREVGSFFFGCPLRAFQFHFEPTNLLKQFGLDGLLLIGSAVPTEHFGATFQQLPFPLADLVRTLRAPDTVFPRQLADRLLTFGRFPPRGYPHPKLEFGTESSALLGHLSDPPRTDTNCGSPL
jgi:hypothetical protein